MKNKNDLSQKIISKIKNEKISIKPKWVFVAGSILLDIGISLSFLTAILFTRSFFYRYRIYSFLKPLYLGCACQRPERHFALPVSISVLAVVLGLVLVRRSKIGYKFNPLLVFLATVAMVVGVGWM